jgi:hypothetical protein
MFRQAGEQLKRVISAPQSKDVGGRDDTRPAVIEVQLLPLGDC